ncbi:hypothetical protein HRR83_008590 [Exophiala dermatitidis]|nr:hypothetical protein HRR75_007786 [Exophiala dermatitidis]KAJ4505591.1 hypothetical protein HRR73_008405 [Exophiala dermatitidis]KAJ4556058.1 hypothetical protein HRR78_001716 [Exophiala dermatitidis]KAJ4588298.1 hypothetical protein HRR83_008590 [Exophiala dermatitidis]KAJ4604080.1 hypothetical protein HRR84_001158 [Exophiala dermatitidis]
MAEVGLVASVFGIVSLGASVSKALFDLGYTMRYARDQIEEIASEVTTFTTIIKQLGAVLKAQKGFFTDEAVKMVEASMKDCKRLFRTIRRQIRRKKDNLLPIRWLFKKRRAEELKRRMDALRGVLGLMLQVVQMGKRIEADTATPDGLSELREEIRILKNEVLAYHRSLPKLQEAEQNLQLSIRPTSTRRGREYHQRVRHERAHEPVIIRVGNDERQRLRARMATGPEPNPREDVPKNMPHHHDTPDDHGSGDADERFAAPVRPSAMSHPPQSEDSDSTPTERSIDDNPFVAMPRPHTNNNVSRIEVRNEPVLGHEDGGRTNPPALTCHVSQRLIATMPYNPTAPIRPPAGPARLTASSSQLQQGQDDSGPARPEDEATSALKLLFTQWTKVNPQLIEDVLDRGKHAANPAPTTEGDILSDDSDAESDSSRGRRPRYRTESELSSPVSRSRSRSRHRPYKRDIRNGGGSGYAPQAPPPSVPEPTGWGWPSFPHMTERAIPFVRHVWHPPHVEEVPLAKVLAAYNGRFVWMLRSPEELTYYVDNQACLRYWMTPGPKEANFAQGEVETVLPKQWVQKKVVELFGFVCKNDGEAHWAIPRQLTYVEVRKLVETSSHLIEEEIRRKAAQLTQKQQGRADVEPVLRRTDQEEPLHSAFTHSEWPNSVPNPIIIPTPPFTQSQSDAGALVPTSRPGDMQLVKRDKPLQSHAASWNLDTDNHLRQDEGEVSDYYDDDNQEENGDVTDVASIHVPNDQLGIDSDNPHRRRRRPSSPSDDTSKTPEGGRGGIGDSSSSHSHSHQSNLSQSTSMRTPDSEPGTSAETGPSSRTGTGAGTGRRRRSERSHTSKTSRSTREQRKARVQDAETQSQATDVPTGSGSTRRHRTRRYW